MNIIKTLDFYLFDSQFHFWQKKDKIKDANVTKNSLWKKTFNSFCFMSINMFLTFTVTLKRWTKYQYRNKYTRRDYDFYKQST